MALVDYIEDYLGTTLATQLGWTKAGGSFDFVVSEAVRLYGVGSEVEATDLDKLYALSKVVLWETVLREISFDYDYSANGASFKRSQVYAQVKDNLEDARAEAQIYLGGYTIEQGTLEGDARDPYSSYPYEDRVL